MLLAFAVLTSLQAFGLEDVQQARPRLHGSAKNVICPIEVKPGFALGALEVGRHFREIQGLGMVIKTVQGSPQLLVVGKYVVTLDDAQRVKTVAAELADLPNCVTFQKRKIMKTTSFKQLSKTFANCKKEPPATGGEVMKCDGILVSIGGWGGKQKSPSLTVIAN